MQFKNVLLSIPLGAGLLLAGCGADENPPPEDENNIENMEEQDHMENQNNMENMEEQQDDQESDMESENDN